MGRVDEAGYGELVEEAEDFLHGKSRAVQDQLVTEMTEASEALDFEAAARLRDRLKAMSHIQASQGVNPSTFEEADLFAAYQRRRPGLHPGVLFPRRTELGQPALFSAQPFDMELPEVLESFVGQFYDERPAPKLMLLSEEMSGRGAAGRGAVACAPDTRWKSPSPSAAKSARSWNGR